MKREQAHTIELISTGASSAKYGNCEVCKKPCSEVIHKTVRKGTVFVSDSFGHATCLEGQ